jgi:hypothetical protein
MAMYVLFPIRSGETPDARERMLMPFFSLFSLSRHQYFIRQNTAVTLAHRMQYLKEPVHKAARSVVEGLRRDEGVGGVIALDNQGNGK